MERHTGFFIKDRPKFDRVIFRIIADTSAQALALERGEVDLLQGSVTLAQFAQLGKAKDVRDLAQGR